MWKKWNGVTCISLVVLALMSVGIMSVYSATFILAQQRFGDGYFFLKKQLFFCGLGFAGMMLFARLPLNAWRRFALPCFAASLVLLLLVLFTPLGLRVSGARRWLALA